MDEKIRAEVADMIHTSLVTVKALSWAMTILLLIFICIFVRTDNFRKHQNKTTQNRIDANTEAIVKDSDRLFELATEASQERAIQYDQASKERHEMLHILERVAHFLETSKPEADSE